MGRYTRVYYGDDGQIRRGNAKLMDKITRAALVDAANKLGYADGMTVVQGSYNTGVGASAGTHDGGGAVDLTSYDHQRKVAELRKQGFAAWYRPAIPGLWGAHIHAVLVGHKFLSPAARSQVADYFAGLNGLANRGPDDGPRQHVGNRYQWKRGAAKIDKARDAIGDVIDTLRYDPDKGIRGYGSLRAARIALRNARSKLPRT